MKMKTKIFNYNEKYFKYIHEIDGFQHSLMEDFERNLEVTRVFEFW